MRCCLKKQGGCCAARQQPPNPSTNPESNALAGVYRDGEWDFDQGGALPPLRLKIPTRPNSARKIRGFSGIRPRTPTHWNDLAKGRRFPIDSLSTLSISCAPHVLHGHAALLLPVLESLPRDIGDSPQKTVDFLGCVRPPDAGAYRASLKRAQPFVYAGRAVQAAPDLIPLLV